MAHSLVQLDLMWATEKSIELPLTDSGSSMESTNTQLLLSKQVSEISLKNSLKNISQNAGRLLLQNSHEKLNLSLTLLFGKKTRVLHS